MRLAALIFLVLMVLPLAVRGEDDSSNTLQEVQASEILIKIQKGEPVEYDHVEVKGDLDLGKLDLPTKHVNRTSFQIDYLGLSETSKVVVSRIRINDSIFDGFVNFNYAILDKSTDMSGSNFTKNAYFNDATFSGDAYFNDATFSGTAGFSGATFSGDAYFNGATFSDYAYFSGATFSDYANFSGATFSDYADFSGATFSGTAYFWGATFSEYAYFSGVTFSGDAEFWGATFSEYATFSGATFSGDADFSGATFSGDADFSGATFSGDAYFGGATFSGDATFGGATFSGSASFRGATFSGSASFWRSKFNQNSSFSDSRFGGYTSFNNASFNKGVLQVGEDTVFSGTLDLNRSNINSIDTYIRWNNIGHLAYNIRAYNLLFDNYKKWRLFEDYNNCYYTFRKELLFQEQIGFTKFLDYLQWILNGFGMKPVFPIMWSIGVILISGSIFYITNGIQRSNAKNSTNVVYVPGYKIPRKPLKERIMRTISQKRTISIGESMLFSATYFSSGANSIISSQPIDLSPIGVSRYIAVLERLLGWFFFALFLAALGNAAIR